MTIRFLGLACFLAGICLSAAGQPRVLIFSRTVEFRHKSIEPAKAALLAMLHRNGVIGDTTENPNAFSEGNLRRYGAVLFLNTTGDVLDNDQQKALEAFIRGGNGFVGIHSAADTEYDWPWYGRLLGAYFKNHPNKQEARLLCAGQAGPIRFNCPPGWTRLDEWYNYKSVSPGISVLLFLDEQSYRGGENGDHHPIAWYQAYDGGRSFYTGMGHTTESYSEPLFMDLLWAGISYALNLP